jgi:hypothetical protein
MQHDTTVTQSQGRQGKETRGHGTYFTPKPVSADAAQVFKVLQLAGGEPLAHDSKVVALPCSMGGFKKRSEGRI